MFKFSIFWYALSKPTGWKEASMESAEYDALVQDALDKLNQKYKELPTRPSEREIIEKIRLADDGQLKKVLEVLGEG